MIRLRTLGALELEGCEGQDLNAVLAQPKRVALLTYLALAIPRGFHRRDTLLALFWPEHDAEHARNSLSQSVHVLRRFLGADLLVSRNGDALGIDHSLLWCDAAAFEAALDAERPQEALDLYRGELLDGLHLPSAPEFERWLDGERARLAARYASALECVAEEREASGDFIGAIALWRKLAARDMYSSRIALRLMRALAASGDPGGAVQHARLHETLLRGELGVAPDPEIAAFVVRLRADGGLTQSMPNPTRSVSANESGTRSSQAWAATGATTVRERAGKAAHGGRRRVALLLAAAVTLCGGAGSAVYLNKAGDPSTPPIRSLAILPWDDVSGDSLKAFFVDGLHDALITELARYPELTVISRTSVLQFRRTRKSLPEIARELKVDGIVEGTVLIENGHVRVNAQLIHGPTDRHLWAGSYVRDFRDVLVLQAEIAEAIARQIRLAATPLRHGAPPTSEHKDSLPNELYLTELYRRGRYAEMSRSFTGIETAKGYYRQAIERDSTFALGYAGLAAVYGFLADYDYAPVGPSLDSARIMAHRAVFLDSTLSDARAALAVTLGDAGDFEGAEREFRRAIELGPSDARAHYWYSILLVALGRGQDAKREAETALALDPVAPRGLTGMMRYSHWLITGDRPHLRLPVDERRPILKLEPSEPWARSQEALEWAQEGRCDKAREEIARAQLFAPHSRRMLAPVASVYWLCGDRKRARAIVDEMKRRPDALDHGYRIALAYTVFGEKDSALTWLARSRWTMAELSGLSADARVDPLRADPRFAALLQRIGIRRRLALERRD